MDIPSVLLSPLRSTDTWKSTILIFVNSIARYLLVNPERFQIVLQVDMQYSIIIVHILIVCVLSSDITNTTEGKADTTELK